MQIFLAALKEMRVHLGIWSFGLILLWIANRKVQRIDRAWIARWEQRHNAPISVFVRSWTKVFKVLTFLKWAVMITTVFVLAWNWHVVQFFFTNTGPHTPGWVRGGGILVTKTMMFFLFTCVFLFLACGVTRTQLTRVRGLSATHEAG